MWSSQFIEPQSDQTNRPHRTPHLRIQVDFIALQHEARHAGPDGIAHRLRCKTSKKYPAW